jgi:hypothetical protein
MESSNLLNHPYSKITEEDQQNQLLISNKKQAMQEEIK